MSDLKTFLDKLGGLHDSVVCELVWRPTARTLEFALDDIYANFEGLQNYPGLTPASLVFQEIEDIHFNIKTNERNLNIDDFVVQQEGAISVATITFWPTGRIVVGYRSVILPPIPFPAPEQRGE
jgi:hypothetical protein